MTFSLSRRAATRLFLVLVDLAVLAIAVTQVFFPRSGYYGPAAAMATGVPGNVWSGNHWVDTGKSIPKPGGA